MELTEGLHYNWVYKIYAPPWQQSCQGGAFFKRFSVINKMSNNVLRQIKDIQFQAEKICSSKPSVEDIENFAKYSMEIKNYLFGNIDIPEILRLVREIPDIEDNSPSLKTGLLFFLIPNFLLAWYYERSYIDEAKSSIKHCQGKYASIEFILKNVQGL